MNPYPWHRRFLDRFNIRVTFDTPSALLLAAVTIVAVASFWYALW